MIDREHKDFIYMLGYEYLQNGKPEKALVLFQALIAGGDTMSKTFQAASLCLLRLQRYREAVQHAEKSIAFCKRHELRFTMLLKARALLHLGKIDEARAIVQALEPAGPAISTVTRFKG